MFDTFAVQEAIANFIDTYAWLIKTIFIATIVAFSVKLYQEYINKKALTEETEDNTLHNTESFSIDINFRPYRLTFFTGTENYCRFFSDTETYCDVPSYLYNFDYHYVSRDDDD